MSNSLSRRAAEIGDEALDFSAGPQRDGFIEQACGTDETLRSMVLAYVARADANSPLFDDLQKESTDFLLGRTIGKWKPIRRLGEGGFGVVYLAERVDGQVRQFGAMKFLQGTVRDRDIELRFRDERQILANMKHEYIVGLIDAGVTEEQQPYFVMEFIEDADSIVDYCRKHNLSVRDCLELFRKVCEAVAYAHNKGAFHRDLKPENILVTKEKSAAPRDGKPHLVDFGLAKILDPIHRSDDRAAPRTNVQLGTPRYSSPEQVRREPIDAATDVYSLGVILYEILAGTDPYELDRRLAERANRWVDEIICTVDPESPSHAVLRTSSVYHRTVPNSGEGNSQPSPIQIRRRKEVAGDLDAVVLMALRKERKRRYGSVGEFSQDIERYLLGKPVVAQPDSRGYRTRKFIQRFKWQVGSAITVLLLVLGGAVQQIVLRGEAEGQRDEAYKQSKRANEQEKKANQETQKADEAASDARDQARIAANEAEERAKQERIAKQEAIQARDAERTAEAQTSLAERRALSVQASLVDERLRNEPVAGLSLAVQAAQESLQQFHSLTPDIRRAMKTAIDSSFEQTVLSSLGPFTVKALTFNRDDTALLGASGLHKPAYTYRWILDAKRVREVQEQFPPPDLMFPEDIVALSPLNGQLLSGDHMGHLTLADFSGKTNGTWNGHVGEVTALAFSPDGKLIASAGKDKLMKIWELDGKLVASTRENGLSITRIAFSPDHTFIATGAENGAVQVWSASDGRALSEPLRGHQGAVTALQISRENVIASGSDDRTIRLWWHGSEKTGGARWFSEQPLIGHDSSITALAFSADGSRLATGSKDGSLHLWEGIVTASVYKRESFVLKGHHAPITAVAFSHSGHLLASAADEIEEPNGFYLRKIDHTVRLWDVEGALEEVRTISADLRRFVAVAYSRSGDGLLAIGTTPAVPDLRGPNAPTMDEVQLWTSTGETAGNSLRHQCHLTAVTFSQDGKLVVTGCDNSTIRVWDVTGRLRQTITGRFGASTALGMDDGDILVAGGNGTVHRFALDGRELGSWAPRTSGTSERFIISSSGKTVAVVVCNDNCPGANVPVLSLARGREEAVKELYRHDSLQIYDSRTGRLTKQFTFAGHITAVAFNDDDTYIAASILGMDDILWLRENTADRVHSFKGQRQSAAMAFTKDSQMLWTMDDNGMIAFWNVSGEHQGERLGRDFRPRQFGDMFWMAFDQSGSTLATADAWGRIILYRADWLLRGCDRLHDIIETDDVPTEEGVRIPLADRKKLSAFCEAYTNENAKQ